MQLLIPWWRTPVIMMSSSWSGPIRSHPVLVFPGAPMLPLIVREMHGSLPLSGYPVISQKGLKYDGFALLLARAAAQIVIMPKSLDRSLPIIFY